MPELYNKRAVSIVFCLYYLVLNRLWYNRNNYLVMILMV